MDSAEHGVVLFTMGFIFNAKVDIKKDSFRCQNKMYLLTFEVIFSVALSLLKVPNSILTSSGEKTVFLAVAALLSWS